MEIICAFLSAGKNCFAHPSSFVLPRSPEAALSVEVSTRVLMRSSRVPPPVRVTMNKTSTSCMGGII